MSILFSQTTGKIKGVVTDEAGKPLSGANVIVIGTTWGAEADSNGYYYIIGVKKGKYKLKCENSEILLEKMSFLNLTVLKKQI